MVYRIGKIIALMIGLEACLVMTGWFLGIDWLTRLSPAGINMKFFTALIFLFSAAGFYFVIKLLATNDEAARVILPGIALFVFLITVALFATDIFSQQINSAAIFTRAQGGIDMFGAGLPSPLSALAFIIFGLVQMACLLPGGGRYRMLTSGGGLILLIGLTALIGYVVNQPLLYYQFGPSAIPMALNTALTFTLLGGGLVIITRQPQSL